MQPPCRDHRKSPGADDMLPVQFFEKGDRTGGRAAGGILSLSQKRTGARPRSCLTLGTSMGYFWLHMGACGPVLLRNRRRFSATLAVC